MTKMPEMQDLGTFVAPVHPNQIRKGNRPPGKSRGAKNDDRGSSEQRRRSKIWLVDTYRADVDLIWEPEGTWLNSGIITIDGAWIKKPLGEGEPACRCYRCGVLLTAETVTRDRIIPRCKGGTYRRNNIRPACAPCNSETGGALANGKVHQPAKQRAKRKKTIAA